MVRNIAENFNRLSRAHERYRQTTDGRTADDNIANLNLSSRSLIKLLKIVLSLSENIVKSSGVQLFGYFFTHTVCLTVTLADINRY